MKKVKLKKDVFVNAYTETDLSNQLSEHFDIPAHQSKEYVNKLFDLLSDAIIDHEAVLIRNFVKFTKKTTQMGVFYHPREHFDLLKSGEIQNLKELPASHKKTKPFFRVRISLCRDFRKRIRDIVPGIVDDNSQD